MNYPWGIIKRAREAAAVTVQLFPWMPPMENPFKPIFEFIAHTYYLVLFSTLTQLIAGIALTVTGYIFTTREI